MGLLLTFIALVIGVALAAVFVAVFVVWELARLLMLGTVWLIDRR